MAIERLVWLLRHMTRRDYAFRAAGACFLAALVGCGPSPAPSLRSEKVRVALVMPSNTEPWSAVRQAAASHQKAHAREYVLEDPLVGSHVEQVVQCIDRHVRVMVIVPTGSADLALAVEKAQTAGILVVSIGQKWGESIAEKTGLVVPYVGPDTKEAARRVGMALALKLAKGDEVACLEEVDSIQGSEVLRGFRAALTERGMKDVGTESVTRNQAREGADRLLSSRPGLKGILCATDALAIAAADAVQAADRKAGVIVACFGHSGALDPYLDDRRVMIAADPQMDQWATNAIESALKAIRDEAPLEDKFTPVELIIR